MKSHTVTTTINLDWSDFEDYCKLFAKCIDAENMVACFVHHKMDEIEYIKDNKNAFTQLARDIISEKISKA